ncbi:MAG: hypothetical protein JKY84_04190 [Emcibacteraceae bacterium]|nr:hypothetical protein [Emcibacteraceae bacterium]
MEPAKFIFDDDFTSSNTSGSYSNKIQKLNDDAFTEGKEQGYTEALQSIEKSSEIILEDIKNSVSSMFSRHEEQVVSMEQNAATLVLAIIQKLAPAIVADKPLQEIENLVLQCLRNNPLEPRMVIRVDEKMLPLLGKKIDQLKTTSDYHGQIVLISDTMSNVSDCKVEWIDGGAERDFEELMKSIEETVQIFINAPSDTDNGIDNNVGVQQSVDMNVGEFPNNLK